MFSDGKASLFHNAIIKSRGERHADSDKNASAEVSAFQITFQNLSRLFLTVSFLILAIGLFINAILLIKLQNSRYREMGLMSALGYTKATISHMIIFLLSVFLTAVIVIVKRLSSFGPFFCARSRIYV